VWAVAEAKRNGRCWRGREGQSRTDFLLHSINLISFFLRSGGRKRKETHLSVREVESLLPCVAHTLLLILLVRPAS
jgi:hypothetical protein